MTATLLVIHVLLALGLIAVVLVQRASSDGGGLTGGGSSNFGGLMSVRGTANLLTRITSLLAGAFIVTSILLTILAGARNHPASLTDSIKPAAMPAAPATAPAQPAIPLSK